MKTIKEIEKGCGNDIYTKRKGFVYCGDSEGFLCKNCKGRIKDRKEITEIIKKIDYLGYVKPINHFSNEELNKQIIEDIIKKLK